MRFKSARPLLIAVLASLMAACAPQVTTQVSSGIEGQNVDKYASYNGPRAKIVIAPFECRAQKCGPSAEQVGAAALGSLFGIKVAPPGSVGDEISTILTTALVNTNHYIIYDRSILDKIRQEAQLGGQGTQLEGADIILTGAITAFEPDAGGTGAAGLLGALPVIGAIAGSQKKSYVAIDMRLVDARSGAVLSAFRVQGEATDTDIGGALGAILPGAGLGGALKQYEKTPMGKAIAIMVSNALDEIIRRTPSSYFRYNPDGTPYQGQSQGSAPKP